MNSSDDTHFAKLNLICTETAPVTVSMKELEITRDV